MGIGEVFGKASWGWLLYLVASIAAIGVYFLLPSQAAQSTLYNIVAVCAVVAALVGIRLHNPVPSPPWYLLALGLLTFVVGDIIWTFYEIVLRVQSPFPSVADAFYLAAPPCMATGLWLMLRERALGRARATFIDASIVATVVGMILWGLLADPHQDPSRSLLERLIAIAYPVMSMALLVVALWLWFMAGRESVGNYLLGASLLLLATADTGYAAALVDGYYGTGDPIDAGWLLSYVLVGATALHPSMANMAEPAPQAEAKLRSWRLALVTGTLLAPPAILVYQAAFDDHVNVWVIAGGSVVLFALAAARVGGMIAEHERVERRFRAAEEKYRSIFENAVEGIFQSTLDGRLLTANPAMAHMFGYESPEEMISYISDTEKQLWVSAEEQAEYVRRLHERGVVVGAEVRMKRKDGSMAWVSANARVLEDAEGKAIGLEGTLEDITQRRRVEEALREAEDRYRTLVEQMPALTYIEEPGEPGRTTYVSPQYETILGYSPDEVSSNPAHWRTILHPEDRERVLAEDRRTNETGEPFAMEYRQLAKDGRVVWLRDEATLVRDGEGKPLYWLGVQTDITRRKAAEEALREAEQRFRSSFEHAAIGMALVGTDGRWMQVNRSICDITGYAEEELLSQTFQSITHPDDLEKDLAYVRQTLAGEIRTYQMEKRYFHKNGHTVWVLLSVSLVRDAQGSPLYFISQIQDITERKALEERLKHQALHDPLTGLANRTLFMNRLEHALARAKRNGEGPLAVLFMDLDDFKVINDSLGHEMGDELLVEVAQRLRLCLRPGDTLARFGGDEFVVLLEDVKGPSDATEVAGRIVDQCRGPFLLKGKRVFAAVSIGVALGVPGRDDLKSVLRDADTAMYKAKEDGELRVFEPRMYDQSGEANGARRQPPPGHRGRRVRGLLSTSGKPQDREDGRP